MLVHGGSGLFINKLHITCDVIAHQYLPFKHPVTEALNCCLLPRTTTTVMMTTRISNRNMTMRAPPTEPPITEAVLLEEAVEVVEDVVEGVEVVVSGMAV